MARGWGRKPVEARTGVAGFHHSAASTLDQEQMQLIRRKETLQLSRTKVVRDMESALNPRYQVILKKALADLDAQLASFAAK